MTYIIRSLTSSGVASRIHRWIASGVAGRIPRWIVIGLGCGLTCGIVCGLICGIVCGALGRLFLDFGKLFHVS